MAPKPSDDQAALEQAATELMSELQTRLAGNIQRLRKRNAWRQEEAAWRAQIGVRMYQRLEGGQDVNATFWTLVRLCAAFEVDVTELLRRAKAPAKRPPGRPPKAARPKRSIPSAKPR